MVKPEIVRQWRVEKAARIVERVVKNFSTSGSGQVNLAAKSAQRNLTQQVVSELDAAGLIRGYPGNSLKTLER